MTVLDLGSLPALDLPPLPVDLQGATYPVPFHHACPYCVTRPAGLLAGHCGDPACRTAYLDADREMERLADL
ncbi:hypothetical protein [Plantactinospora sp. WMMB782]|uniref:hypothetical protein n=1 Tax=Plantactinospora sp. WMMB782 TaxID=3404121 RepID=UPI003B941DE3